MERLWTPWRMEYVAKSDDENGCIFCEHLAESDDEAARILHRGETVFVILNAFPYNTGHLMVAPTRHAGTLKELDVTERSELMEITSASIDVIQEVMSPHGFNVGMNLGRVAGAGIPGHVHAHVVPRWGGDTNFMPVVADTKVLPELLDQTYAKLRPGFAELEA